MKPCRASFTVPQSPDSHSRPVRALDERFVLLCVLLVSAAYVLWHLDRGWIAHDEGTLGQSAVRVLHGELPHRDFTDVYTGGLAYLNSAAFRLLGTTLWTMRIVLFTVFLAWVPAVFYVARRFVNAAGAAAMAILAVVWTLPNYPAPLPSWYNLFLATFGVAALCRHIETERQRWLVLAGVVGGLSCLVKVIGLYYVAGALLFLVFRANERSRRMSADKRRDLAYPVFVTAALGVFVAGLFLLVRRQLYLTEVVQFVLPGSAIAALLVYQEWNAPAGDSRSRVATLARLVFPFLFGLAIPIAIFLVPYLRSGAVSALIDGVFILPTKRFSFASMRAMPVWWTLSLIPVALLMMVPKRGGTTSRWATVLLALALAALLVLTGYRAFPYRMVWLAAFSVMPLLVVIGVVLLARPRTADGRDPLLRQRTMLLLSITAICSIVQFPFSVPIYFCYAVPLIALSAMALSRYLPPMAVPVPAALLAFFIAFAVLRTNPSDVATFGDTYVPFGPVTPLLRAHGGLQVQAEDGEMYNRVVAQLHQRARGDYTWASPDSPEIYFLAGLKNPTRSLFEFFEDSTNADARILEALDARGVTAIVLNSRPSFSPPISPVMYTQLNRRFPHARNIGIFQLRWRQ